MIDGYPAQSQIDIGLVREVFGRAGVPAATNILQTRGISYVGINELTDSIIIFTKRKLSISEQKLFAGLSFAVGGARMHVEFVHGNTAHVGPNPPPAPAVVPYTIGPNGQYTCGSSVYIGSEKGAGTLGCLVRDRAGHLYGLSNNHVTGGSNYALPGLPVVAPGMADVTAGGRDPETLGHHAGAYPFIDGIPGVVDARQNLDAAVFAILDENRVSSMQRNRYDTPSRFMPLEVGLNVEKVGRSSDRTTGEVFAELFDFEPVTYVMDIIRGFKIVYFMSLFAVKSTLGTFSVPGDSGSLVVTTNRDGEKIATGIVVAGNDEGVTLCLSIDRVLTHFGVTLVSGHNI